MQLTAALPTVTGMLLCAVPGFIVIKTKLIPESAISAFAKLLMTVCQPALMIYSFMGLSFTPELLWQMVTAFLILLIAQGAVIGAGCLIFRRREEPRFRIYILAAALGNCGFMGVPLLQALLPDYPQALAFSAMASVVLNLLGWTVGSFVITRDRRYIQGKKLLLNPAIPAVAVALFLFVNRISLPSLLSGPVTLLARMTTPLCMLIMGMRLAVCPAREVFQRGGLYATVAVKQIVFPLVMLIVLRLLPLDNFMKSALLIIVSCPVASAVLNFSEMLENGQQTAAGAVLLGTLASIVTVPLMTAPIPEWFG